MRRGFSRLPIFEPTLGVGVDANASGTTVVKGIEVQTQAVVGGLSVDVGGSFDPSTIGQFSAIDEPLPGRWRSRT